MLDPSCLGDAELIESPVAMFERKSAAISSRTRSPPCSRARTPGRCSNPYGCRHWCYAAAPTAGHRWRSTEQIAALVTGAHLEVVGSAGHVSTIEQPEAVAQALLAWLHRVEG